VKYLFQNLLGIFSSILLYLSGFQQVANQVIDFKPGELFVVVERHRGMAAIFQVRDFGALKQVERAIAGLKYEREVILGANESRRLQSIIADDRHELSCPFQSSIRIEDGGANILSGPAKAVFAEVSRHISAVPVEHVAGGAVCLAEEERLSGFGVPDEPDGRANALQLPQTIDDQADLLATEKAKWRHSISGQSILNGSRQIGGGLRDDFAARGDVGRAFSSMAVAAVTDRTVGGEKNSANLLRLGLRTASARCRCCGRTARDCHDYPANYSVHSRHIPDANRQTVLPCDDDARLRGVYVRQI